MRRHRRQTRRTWQSRMRQNLLKAMPEKHLLRRKNPRKRHRNPRKLMQRARQRQALSNLLTAEGTAPSARDAGGSGSRFETGNTGENGKDNSASDDYYYGYY